MADRVQFRSALRNLPETSMVAGEALVGLAAKPYPFDTPLSTRQPIVDKLKNLLNDSDKIITLTGPEGSGKTTIAEQLAAQLGKGKTTIDGDLLPDILLGGVGDQLSQRIPGYKEARQSLGLSDTHDSLFDQVQSILKPFDAITEPLKGRETVIFDGLTPFTWEAVEILQQAVATHRGASKIPLNFFVVPDEFLDLPESDVFEVRLEDEIPPLVVPSLQAIAQSYLARDEIPEDWPSPQDVQDLGQKAVISPLFASTAVEYLRNKLFHPTRLSELLSLPWQSPDGIPELYSFIIKVACDSQANAGLYLACLQQYAENLEASTLPGQVTLPITQLFQHLLRVSKDDLDGWVDALHPLFYYPQDKAICPSDLSFFKRGSLLQWIPEDKRPPVEEIDRTMAIGCLQAISHINMGYGQREDEYPARFILGHLQRSTMNLPLRRALEGFNMDKFLTLRRPENSTSHRALFWWLVPQFLKYLSSQEQVGQIGGNLVSQYRMRFEAHVKTQFSLYREPEDRHLLTLTAFERKMHAILHSQLADVPGEETPEVLGDAYSKAKSDVLYGLSRNPEEFLKSSQQNDHLGLIDSFDFLKLYGSSFVASAPGTLWGVLETYEPDLQSYNRAFDHCFSYFKAHFKPESSFLVDQDPESIQGSLQETARYKLCLYYMFRMLDGAYLQPSTDIADQLKQYNLPGVGKPTRSYERWETGYFRAEVARAIRQYITSYDAGVSGRIVVKQTSTPQNQPPSPASSTSDLPQQPESRAPSVAGVAPMPTLPDTGSVTDQRRPSEDSATSHISQRSGAPNDAAGHRQHHYTAPDYRAQKQRKDQKQKVGLRETPLKPSANLLSNNASEKPSNKEHHPLPKSNGHQNDGFELDQPDHTSSCCCSCCSGCQLA